MKLFLNSVVATTSRGILAAAFATQLFLPCFADTITTATVGETNSPDSVTSQSLPADFDKQLSGLIKDDKFDDALKLIARQEALTPDDPDLAVAKANLNLLMPEARPRVVINQYPDDSAKAPDNVRKPLQVVDAETSQPAGYIGEEVPAERAQAIKRSLGILKGAAEKHPERLDIRIGISQLHALNGDYESLLKNHEEILKYASSKNYKGLMLSKGRPAPEPEVSLSNDLHHYYSEYTRETENPDDKLAFRFAETATRYFPKDVRAWNNLCAEYAQRKDNDQAIESLLKAYEIDKKDPIVLMNIAHLYTVTKKPEDAIKYYQKVIDLNDPNFTEDARQAMDELKK